MKSKRNNRGAKKRKTGTTYKKSRNKTGFKFNKELIILLLIGIALLLLLLKLIGLLFTIIMVVGIALILFLSKVMKKLRRKKSTRIIINILLIIGLLLCIAGCIGVTVFFYYVVKEAPEFNIANLERSESTLLYDKDNVVRAELGVEKREEITYDEISQVFIDALIATEDSKFFQHNGFDAARFLKASLGQVAGKTDAGGASTISMQVIKNSFTDAKLDSGFKGIVRKFTDIYLAVFELEKAYSKQEIIEFYVNVHYMGAGAYGVEQASQTYFDKSARDLNLAEASLLAGLFKSPSSLDPFKYPEDAESRRNTVLNLMVRHGYITKEEADMAKAIPVTSLLTDKKSQDNQYQSYIDQVAKEIENRYGVNIYNTPMLIYTNMDTAKQTGIDNIFNGTTYNWTDPVVQAGIAVVDVDTGKIVAIGGGRSTGANNWNYASGNKRQIGSTAKPLFDYAPGIEYNNWSPATLFEDKEYYYSSGQPIRNSDRQYWGWMTLRDSLAYSRNVPALQAFQQVDKNKIIDMVTRLGITPEIDKYGNIHEAHSIGAFTGSNALEMAAAYAAFANGGDYYEPYTVHKVVFRNTGKEDVYTNKKDENVMSDSTAFMITDSLRSAVTYGLSNGARVNGVNVAAKTGTTNYPEALLRNNGYPLDIVSDAWVIGYDPEYSIGLWYGYPELDKTYNLKQTVAVVERGRLFRAAGEIVFTKNYQDFKVPKSVVKVAIEKGSNPIMLPSENTPGDMIVEEYFAKGTEPTEISPAYRKLDNVTNLSVTYNPTTMTVNISWSKAAKQNAKDSYGNFGYKVYKDGTYLGFTEKNYFTLSDEDNPFATYKVITTFEKYNGMDSSGATFELDDGSAYTAELLVPENGKYTVGDNLDSWDQKPSQSDIKLYRNNKEEKSFKVEISIKNSSGDTVSNITTNNKEEYTVTYKVYYDDEEVVSVNRKIKIEESN
ncbi:MAG: transglycosylase domain-containing protein [Bacilli bacterium]|nr:transglycosylase domain-containing protein [Bacilli bacterium]